VPTGIEGFDSVVEGGIPKGSLVLITGSPGSGKTIFSARYLYYGASKIDEPSLHVSFAENRETFLANMRRMGMDFEKYEQDGKFRFTDLITVTDKGVADVLTGILEEIDQLKAKRLVIDSFSTLAQAFKEPIDARIVLHTILSKMVRQAGCTALLVVETPTGRKGLGLGVEEFVADGVINLRKGEIDGRRYREIELSKLRGTEISQPRYVFTMNGGFRVCAPFSLGRNHIPHDDYVARVDDSVDHNSTEIA
jgi:circadian clock protein KaiC